jgi:uncharacterized protein (TIGR03083 family)
VDDDGIWRAVERERRELADLLESLDDEQWNTPSLCRGWTVHDVATHLTAAPRITFGAALVGLARARGNFDRFVHEDVVARRSMTHDEVVAEIRALAASRRHPPSTTPADPLVDMLVHGQDIALPLGIERTMPTEAAVTACEYVWRRRIPFNARKRFRDYRIEATNAPFAAGEGATVRGPVEAVLLALTGRAEGAARLEGDTTTGLSSRFT